MCVCNGDVKVGNVVLLLACVCVCVCLCVCVHRRAYADDSFECNDL